MLKPGDRVVWYKSRPWGGKYAVQATVVGYSGKQSIRLCLDDGCTMTVTVRIQNVIALEEKCEAVG